MNLIKLKNWGIVVGFCNFIKPELLKGNNYYLQGNVYGNSKFSDGTSILTTAIKDIVDAEEYKKIYTQNTIYYVYEKDVSEDCEKEYPSYFKRLSIK